MKLIELHQSQAAELNKDMTALLPLGAVEVHGEHLPIGTDDFLSEALCQKLEECIGTDKVLILPLIPYGQVWSLGKVPGSVDIPDETLSQYIKYVALAVEQMGLRKLAVINSHVGNVSAIKNASRMLKEDSNLLFYSFTYPGADQVIKDIMTSPLPHHGFFHACEIETSYMLYLCPDKVDMSRAICQYPDFPSDYDYRSIRWSEVMNTAVLGDAEAATKEKGKRVIDVVIENIVNILNDVDSNGRKR